VEIAGLSTTIPRLKFENSPPKSLIYGDFEDSFHFGWLVAPQLTVN